MTLLVAAAVVLSAAVPDVATWTFDEGVEDWHANSHLANVAVKDGALSCDAVDWDPFFTRSGLEVPAIPWQWVLIRVKADKAGQGELFWTGATEGKYQGFDPSKRTPFRVKGDGSWENVVVLPFWHTEKVIRQLRLDLYEGAHFDIDSITIMNWGDPTKASSSQYSWQFGGDTSAWRVSPDEDRLFSPPLNLDVEDRGWVSVELKAERPGTATLLWAAMDRPGLQSVDFPVRPGSEASTHNIELQGMPGWKGKIASLGIILPKAQKGARLESIAIADRPLGPAEIEVEYLGFENGVNRAGRPCSVIARVKNIGGADSGPLTARLVLSQEMRFSGDSTLVQQGPGLKWDEWHTFSWQVRTVLPGEHDVFLKVGDAEKVAKTLDFAAAAILPKSDYVPKPDPIRRSCELCAYYFPGWSNETKWDCIRATAPNRKPVLGYYDESNPECVDWQIKWAVENGISCFLVDWYWCAGHEHLKHWFEAYRKARYRDMLKVSIMWANHNAAGTHSAEDWRKVTQEWIDNYFNLPGYFQIDGKPAVFIWAPSNIRRDVGGVEAAKALLDESQKMAKEAGYEGITFVAMGYNFAASTIDALTQEGYSGVTTYHEWGVPNAGSLGRMPFTEVVKHSPDAWAEKEEASKGLTYYPVIDTGWDSRPWHGNKAFVIDGRTPELFEHLCEAAEEFAQEHEKPFLILGPMNEWGEGSYIEPCTEYGFRMLEALRNVFGLGNWKKWPQNIGPSDVGLGPYDYPSTPPTSEWTFDAEPAGWSRMMAVSDVVCADGVLRFKTLSTDPAINSNASGIQAAGFSKFVVRMQVIGELPEGAHGQLFWSANGQSIGEASSVGFRLERDGQFHDYTVDLKSNPRWRGRISTLRFDPCATKDVEIVIDSIAFQR